MTQETEREFHRKNGVECFNRAWEYLDKKDRTSYDDQLMLHLAHASRYHWSFAGTPKNLAIGDWQISRVYAALNEPDLALHFAKTSVQICQKNNLSEQLISAYEGMARAYATAKDHRLAREYINKARDQLRVTPMDDDDKKIYSDQIRETEQLTDE
jgi:tetratricopeptide (TPR) repeat protein